MIVVWLGLMLLPATAQSQEGLSPELLTLARIKQRMGAVAARLPNYTCLETIERSEATGSSGEFVRLDLLRLEVAHAGDKELYAWPGAGRFEGKGPSEMIGVGMIGSGDFAAHVRDIFLGRSPTFRYLGEEDASGVRAVRYAFQVSQLNSGYTIHSAMGSAVVPYHGSFWADAGSLDLIRLEVRADEIPEELGISRLVTNIRYAMSRIGGPSFLLPRSAEVQLTPPSGMIRRNRIEFTNCRQYLAESVVKFEAAEAAPAAGAAPPVKQIDLPADLSLAVSLETPIDSETSAVGDAIRARVPKDVKQDGRLIVPRGAILNGRIRRLIRQPDLHIFWVSLQFTEFEFDGSRGDFHADLEDAGKEAGVARGLSVQGRALVHVQEGASGDRKITVMRETITPAELSGIGAFLVKGDRVTLPRGFRMVWKTIPPPSTSR